MPGRFLSFLHAHRLSRRLVPAANRSVFASRRGRIGSHVERKPRRPVLLAILVVNPSGFLSGHHRQQHFPSSGLDEAETADWLRVGRHRDEIERDTQGIDSGH